MNKTKIKIDVVSDVVCPWCFIGKQRLEKAMSQLSENYDFEVTYLPFELNPEMPSQGKNQKEYLSTKFGGFAKYEQITSHVTKIAAEEGLAFDFGRQDVSPNTHHAHRLIWFARESGKQREVNEALMKAYFEDGINLSDRSNLVNVVVGAGLSRAAVETFLDSDDGKTEVLFEQQRNQQRGIRGVPFFIINNTYGISGAQPTEVFVNAITKIGLETRH